MLPSMHGTPGFRTVVVILLGVTLGVSAVSACAAEGLHQGEMAGYRFVPNDKVPPNFNAGFSPHVAARAPARQ